MEWIWFLCGMLVAVAGMAVIAASARRKRYFARTPHGVRVRNGTPAPIGSPVPPDALEEQWRTLFAYKGRTAQPEGKEDIR